jgi:hypothetical protein
MDPVRKFCRDEDLEFIDLKDAFVAQPAEVETGAWFANRFHYSAEGNRVVADWIQREIDRREW